MASVLKVIGLMSGTSLDGVDAALIETDGERVAAFGPALTVPYTPAQREVLRAALKAAAGDGNEAAIAAAEGVLTKVHTEAVRRLLAAADTEAGAVDLIGYHGQTVLHQPAQRLTWQIGDGVALARETGIDVINDFRTADVAAGGQGAPLVPLYHQALVMGLRTELPLAVVNIGGVANVTYVGADGSLLAFDTGPGNAPIDDWALRHTGEAVDKDGALAASGAVDAARLAAMLDHPFFEKVPPKSLDRMDFGMAAVEGLAPATGAATLTAFTAASIARAGEHFPAAPTRWLICGGGRRNPALMAALAERLSGPVAPVETVGWRGDFLEAEAFAFLAVRSARGLPLSLPTTTGVPAPMPGGRRSPKP
ncbi:MAG: anhydro-N-acetylmuramic acid kinase [Alphaproteobacteria bacterium]|nr:anhydro-N-acetylmuramic acid kinase [Alphaproteobacteria bacterium]